MLDELLPYYEKELSHLRFLGQEFAAQYPKIASRLLIEGDNCEDPHTERLIEAFSFLSARVHKNSMTSFRKSSSPSLRCCTRTTCAQPRRCRSPS